MGFEALYWQPFVQALIRDGVAPERLIPISRGGAAVWYGTPTGVELYGMRTPQQIRLAMIKLARKYGSNKQAHVTAFDRAILHDTAETLQLPQYWTLHPAWLYQTCWPFWGGLRGIDWITPRLAIGPMPLPALPQGLELPPAFVAAKFYWRTTFPPEMSTKSFVEACLRHVAKRHPVILLDTPFHVDDHMDCALAAVPNVTPLSQLYPHLTVETALAVQSAVLGRAIGFVGTYGGTSHLALRYGRPNVSLYLQWHGAALAHKHLCEAIGLAMGVPTHVLSLADVPMLQAALPTALVEEPTPGSSGLDTSKNTLDRSPILVDTPA